MIFFSRIVPISGPKAMCGANMFAMFLREPYEGLLGGNVPESLARLVARLDTSPGGLRSPQPSCHPLNTA
jgi:hypothetical protein